MLNKTSIHRYSIFSKLPESCNFSTNIIFPFWGKLLLAKSITKYFISEAQLKLYCQIL